MPMQSGMSHPQVDMAWSILWPSSPSSSPHIRPIVRLEDGPITVKTLLPPSDAPTLGPHKRHRPGRGMTHLPAEVWQSILLQLPARALWGSRAVHPAWKTFVEQHLCRALLGETRLILQVDTRPSFDFFGSFPAGRVREGWLEYQLPEEGKRRWPWAAEKARLGRDGRHLFLGGKVYAVQVSIAGYLGPVPTARKVEYEEKGRVVRVDWRVLLCSMFGEGGSWARELRLGEMMHRPEREREGK